MRLAACLVVADAAIASMLVALVLGATGAAAAPGALPVDAARLLPQLRAEMDATWPGVAPRAWIPALIEQESLWRERATLRTAREHGCGVGQFTRAFAADGSLRFDALAETRALDPRLAGWSWADCARPEYQLRAVVVKLRMHDRQCQPLVRGNRQVKACAAAMYNGGAGSVAKRVRSCSIASGCDPGLWFDHLERQCPQSRQRVAGYGESFCDINSKYPARVEARMPRYEKVMR
ncbi:Transglycosylase SLT domain protein [Cupriavidus oxalaticus]|uniref:hypothetical protein n=1 Tax=Cupriavidus oxalaticus TaxID=96344 RepID=UPI003F73CAE5